jgi:exodeoxyribonuclease VII large subunit
MIKNRLPLSSETTEKKTVIYTVSALNHMVQDLLDDVFLPLWIEGEISNFACPSSGHWYFSLKDKQAQVRCALFNGKQRFKGLLQPKEGLQVLVRAKVSLYPVRGEFQLIVEHLELAGEGALRQAFEQLKQRLAQEGLFSEQFKKALPSFPKTIGVITSATGAVLRDISVITKKRFAAIRLIIYPCRVQGNSAAAEIAAQIKQANERRECDVLILARGGGSLEDLWPFNEEIVARAIFASELPLISAIGHETDFTIADFVADCRAATPSMAAQLATPNGEEYAALLNKFPQRLRQAIYPSIQHHQQSLAHLSKRLRHPQQRLHDQAQRCDELTQRLTQAIKRQLNTQQQSLTGLARMIQAISPLASLDRGYALIKRATTDELIRHSQEVAIGEQVFVQLAQGHLICRVETKQP